MMPTTATHECTCGSHAAAVNDAASFEITSAMPGFVPTVASATEAQRAQLARPIEFEGPIAIEGVLTGDRRLIAPGALSMRDLPLPLAYLDQNKGTHEGAVLSGLITRLERRGDEMWSGGVFNDSPAGHAHRHAIATGIQPWVSVDLDSVTAEYSEDRSAAPVFNPLLGESTWPMIQTLTSARVMGATGVILPALQSAKLTIRPLDPVAPVVGADGTPSVTLQTVSSSLRWQVDVAVNWTPPVLAAHAAADDPGFPERPPVEWFENPRLTGPTHLFVEPNGRIYGHIAAFNQSDGSPSCHIGIRGGCVTVPRSMTNYAKFAKGAYHVLAQDGSPSAVPRTGIIYCPRTVGQLNHPPAHLEDTEQLAFFGRYGAEAAQVAIGEDDFGIWVAGAMRSTATWAMAQQISGGDVSGHWISGELRAITAVPHGGFDVPGVRFSLAADGSVQSLVGAGKLTVASPPAPTGNLATAALERRIEALERIAGPARRQAMADILAGVDAL